ncbi:MAG: DUF4124 domain-containing protein, partial [Phreatobacter sp.]|nr:DUF4124 domain-containing protein [Phreatobacter sp.]
MKISIPSLFLVLLAALPLTVVAAESEVIYWNSDAGKALRARIFLALFFCGIALPAYAGVYKWVDEKGNVHYSEQPPKAGDHTQLRAQPAESNPQPYSENKAVSQLRQMEADKSERNRIQYQKQRLELERQIRERDKETADPKYWEREKQRQADEKKTRDDA